MGRTSLLIGIVCVIAGLCGYTFGQSKAVDTDEIDRLIDQAKSKLRDLSYTIRHTESSGLVGKLEPSHIETTEYQRPDRIHSVEQEKKGQLWTTHESIWIGDNEYVREGNEPWRLPSRGTGYGMGVGSGSADDSDATYVGSDLGVEQVGGKSVRHYRELITVTYHVGNLVHVIEQNVLFDEKGRLVRDETKRSSSDSKEITVELDEYDYDKPIRIVAPIK